MPRKSTVKQSKGVKQPAAKKKPGAAVVFQLKITLLGFKPLIWRRIQVEDCTLDKLHEHVQTAMGWTNSHLHQFRIGQVYYGDPELMQETFDELDFRDSTATKISDIVPKNGKKFSFIYEYDFGDSWEHEITVENAAEPEPGKRYPLCMEGQRACPPDDCGGVWGYADLLEKIGDKQHEEHDEMLEWLGGSFDPAAFDAKTATKAMNEGLPDWR